MVAITRALSSERPELRSTTRNATSLDAFDRLVRLACKQRLDAEVCEFLGHRRPGCPGKKCRGYQEATLNGGTATYLYCQGFSRCNLETSGGTVWVDGNVTDAVAYAERRAGKRADVVVYGPGLHLLQLWPLRPFEIFHRGPGWDDQGATSARWHASYEEHLRLHSRLLRERIGPSGLLVWRTVNSVCDELHEAEQYRMIISMFKAKSRDAVPHWMNVLMTPTKLQALGNVSRAGNIAEVASLCDKYVRRMTGSASLDCARTQLSHRGAAQLAKRGRRAMCSRRSTADSSQLAPLRIFDAHTFTSNLKCSAIYGHDSMHFHRSEFAQLRLLSEGVVKLLPQLPVPPPIL
jgi:hypothetical protein